MKKKLLFKNTTQYSKKVYDEFTRFHNNKNLLSYELFTLFILVLLVYCIFATIRGKIFLLSILFVIVLIIFITYRLFSPVILYKKEVAKKANTKANTYTFYFYDKYFKIRNNLDFDKIPYFSLYKVFETKKYYYLYLTKKYSFIVDKENFTLGTSDEFTIFIKNKKKLKYKNNI